MGSEYKDCSNRSAEENEDLSDLLWKIKLASITRDESEEREDDSQVARKSSFPYWLDKNGCVSKPTKVPTSLLNIGNISDSSLQSDSSSHWKSSNDTVNEDSPAMYPNSLSSCTLFSSVSPTWKTKSVSPVVSPREESHWKASPNNQNGAMKEINNRETIQRPKVLILVLLAHLDHVYHYSCLVRDLLRLYSMDVQCMMEEHGSSILPEHVVPIASRISHPVRIMLIGPKHVLDGTCHLQTCNGRYMESNIFGAIRYLLEERVHMPMYSESNKTCDEMISPFCSSIHVFIHKVIQKVDKRHSLHSQVEEWIAVCQSCCKIFKRYLSKQSLLEPKDSFPMDSFLSTLYTTLRRCCPISRPVVGSDWNRKVLYLLAIWRCWKLHVDRIRKECIRLYLPLSHMTGLENELENEMRLVLLNQIVDKCNALDRVYYEMDQLWDTLVNQWLS